MVFTGGLPGTSGGASASTPIFASLINRINELHLNDGKKPLGFLNPALYSNPECSMTSPTAPTMGVGLMSAQRFQGTVSVLPSSQDMLTGKQLGPRHRAWDSKLSESERFFGRIALRRWRRRLVCSTHTSLKMAGRQMRTVLVRKAWNFLKLLATYTLKLS